LYRITNGELIEYRSQYLDADNGEDVEYQFTSSTIQVNITDTIYLCSDGYTDQFGGKDHKKYSRKRLMNFLLNLQDYSMPEQSDKLYEEIEHWREENNEDQTDDILVIGIRI
jgi:serine phosphatase RsbU (regulator of sigma subunit)